MNRIHSKSDFKIRFVFSDKDNCPVSLKDADFDMWFTTRPGGQAYLACQQDGKSRRLQVLDDGSVLVSFDSHALQPGQLKLELTLHTEDSGQPDGWNELTVQPAVPVELIEGSCSSHRPGYDNRQPILVNVQLPLHRPVLQHHVTREELNEAIKAAMDEHVSGITAGDGDFEEILKIFDLENKD